jgi:probable glucitol transport protein GutA
MGKAIFLLIGYMLYDVASTMTEVPYFALTTAMTDNPTERSQIISTSKFVSTLPAFVVLFIPGMYQSIGWKPTVAIFSIFALATMLPGSFLFKERYRAQEEKPPGAAELLRYMRKNKYLIIFFTSAIVYGLSNTVGTVGNLFAIYNLGGDNMITPILLITFIPALLSIFIVKGLLKRMDKMHILVLANIVTIATSILMYITGYENFLIFALLNAIRGFAAGMNTLMYFLFTPDFAEYGTYVTGLHAEGSSFAIQSFSSKVIGALSSSITLLLMSLFGFVSGSDTQTEFAKTGLWLLYSIIPVVGAVGQIVILQFLYKLRDRDVLAMSRANHGEISTEESERLLEGRHKAFCEPQ